MAGFVVNEKNEVLLVQEKWLRNGSWKYPGGMADLGKWCAGNCVRQAWEESTFM